MGVLQRDPSNRGPADMGQHCIGIDPAGGTPKALRSSCSLYPPLNVRFTILVSRKSPAMEVTGTAAIFATLHDQCILRMHERAFNFGELGRSKPVEAAHLLQP